MLAPGGNIEAVSLKSGDGSSERGARAGVLVVGAGPTGLALVAQLDALGATVRIVDRQLDRVHESRALAVLPRTLEVLRGIGVSGELVERGNDAVQVQLHLGRTLVRTRLFDIGLEDSAYPFLLFISQAETETVLNEHLAARGVHVERGVELVALAAEERQVACMLRHQDGTTEQLGAAARHGEPARGPSACPMRIRRRNARPHEPPGETLTVMRERHGTRYWTVDVAREREHRARSGRGAATA